MSRMELNQEPAEGFRHFGMFLVLCIGVGALIGVIARPDQWFYALPKPLIFPPESVVAVIWLGYFTAMAYVGKRLWCRTDPELRWGPSLALWCAQLVCAWSWPLAIYIAHNVGLAAALSAFGALCAVILSFRLRLREPVAYPATVWNAAWFLALAVFTAHIALKATID